MDKIMKIKLYLLAIAGMLVLTACETTETPEPPIGPKYEKEILDNSNTEMSNSKSPKPNCGRKWWEKKCQ